MVSLGIGVILYKMKVEDFYQHLKSRWAQDRGGICEPKGIIFLVGKSSPTRLVVD